MSNHAIPVEALLVVDVQSASVAGDGALPDAAGLLDRTTDLIARARKAGALVVHLQNDGQPGAGDEPHTPGWELHLPVEAGPTETVIRKAHDDGFKETPLGSLLTGAGVRSLAVCGLMSEMCVQATARAALALGYRVVLPYDAHATHDVPAAPGISGVIPAAVVSRVAAWAISGGADVTTPAADVGFTAPPRANSPQPPRVGHMTDLSYLAAVRDSYDTIAADYAAGVPRPAELDPPTRAMLTAFAELARASDLGPVADLGCGPGLTTAYLASLGLPAFGVDLSPKMVALARQAHPALRFTEGSMTALDLGDDELGGILAFYSTHHTPPDQLPLVFAEFHRTLAPGGHLLLGGHIGDEHLSPARSFGHPVSYRPYFLPLPRLVELLGRAGLVVTAQLQQEPDGRVKRRTACLLARKPVRP